MTVVSGRLTRPSGADAVTVALLRCWMPGLGAGAVAVQVIAVPGANVVAGQEMPVRVSSVTLTLFSATLPVLTTLKVTFIVVPGSTMAPGARLESSPLMYLVRSTLVTGWTYAYARSVALTRAGMEPSGAGAGWPEAVTLLTCCLPGAGAGAVP